MVQDRYLVPVAEAAEGNEAVEAAEGDEHGGGGVTRGELEWKDGEENGRRTGREVGTWIRVYRFYAQKDSYM